MKILVTGGAGFIGSHVVDKYLSLGHEVLVLDNLSTGSEKNLNPRAVFVKEDIINNDGVQKIITDFKPDIINHHAALAEVTKSLKDPSKTLETNVIGTANVLLAGGEAGIKKFIFSSTGGAIYGNPEKLPVNETCTPDPLSPYGLSKLLGEKTIEFYTRTYGFEYVIFRYSNVYGPRQNPKGEAGVVAIFSSLMKAGESPIIFGDGSKTRDYVYVEDIALANELAIELKGNHTLNLGGGIEISDKQIFDEVAGAVNFSGNPTYADFRKGEITKISLDASRAKEILGWTPQVQLKDGIKITAQTY